MSGVPARLTAPTALSGASITSTPPTGGYDQSVSVVAFSGAAAVGATATAGAASGAPGVSITPTVTGSVIYGAGDDWDNATARTVNPGQSILNQFVDTATGDIMWSQSVNGTTNAGTPVTLGDTAPTADRYDMAAVEIVPATSVAYTYDADGNLTSESDASGTTTGFDG